MSMIALPQATFIYAIRGRDSPHYEEYVLQKNLISDEMNNLPEVTIC
jgi:hypothetical protein